MNSTLIDSIGYIALTINLYSMSTKGEYKLRLISLVANVIYVFYAALIGATPVIIGCTTAVILHGYHLKRLIPKKTNNDLYKKC